MGVPARLNLVTLGTHDFASMKAFYVGLGWHNLYEGTDDFAMLDTGGAVLALFPYDALAEDAHVQPSGRAQGYRGFTLAINVESRELVDRIIEDARAAGARITREPEDAFWGGRTAYFADPEGNPWEVAWNPAAARFDARGTMLHSASRLGH